MAPTPRRTIEEILQAALSMEDPEREAYLAAACLEFPSLKDLLEDVPEATASVPTTPGSGPDGLLMPAARVERLFAGTERFEAGAWLGSGGFGDVYEVFDRTLGIRLAVKVLRQLDAAAIESFKSEFRVLERLAHRNLCQLYELIFEPEPGHWFLVMERIAGLPLLEYLRAPGVTLRAVFRQAAEGLAALHASGVLHCDIKPSNVLVEAGGRVVLLDFGLARRMGVGAAAEAMTPGYAAPEVVSGSPYTAASDWYSFGVMLRRALKDAAPDGELEALAARLMDAEPAARPGAAAVLGVLAPGSPALSGPVESVFVGREEHLRAVDDAFQEYVERGRGATVRVAGVSGIGKTTFVQHALGLLRGRVPRLRVFEGRCHQGESVPYNAVDEVVDQIAVFLRQMPLGEARGLLPAEFPLLARVFPVLEKLLPRAPGSPAEPELRDTREVRRRAFAAFRELLALLAAREPVVLFLDDLQWSDSDSHQLLRETFEGTQPPALLLILAYRDTAEAAAWAGVGTARRPGAAAREILLGPLGEEQARRLARKLLPQGDAETAQEIARESGGSPLFLRQLASYARQGERAAGVQELIARRVAALPEAEQRLLDVLSVARAPLALTVLRDAAGLGDRVLAARALLTAECLVRASGPAYGAALPYHDRIAEVVSERIPEGRRREIHEQLALTLEEHGDPDAETIAQHFQAAGRLADASRLGKMAAERAAGVLAFDRAAALYEKVIAWGPHEPHEVSELEAARGDALVNCGRGAQAARAFQRAMVSAQAERHLPLQVRFAAELLRSGEVEEGMAELRRLLLDRRLPFPEGRSRVLGRLVWERIRLEYRLRRAGLRSEAAGEPSPEDRAQLDVCWAAAVGTGMVYPVLTEIYCALHLRLALECGAQDRLALAWSSYASRLVYNDDGQCRAAHEMMREAERCAAHDARPYTAAFLTTMRATIAMLTGDFVAAAQQATLALDLYRRQCVGVAWEMATAASYLYTARTVMGDWDRTPGEVARLIQEAQDRGDRYAEVNLRLLTGSYASLLAQDKPEEAEEHIARCLAGWPRGGFDLQQLYALQARVDLDLYRDRPEAAHARMERTWPELQRSGLLAIVLLRNFAEAQRARAALAAAVSRPEGRERRRLVAMAESAAQRLIRSRTSYAPGLGWLLAGGAARVRGDLRQAREYLRRAEVELERNKLIPWLAAARLALAALTEGEEAVNKQQQAMEWMISQNVRRPECLARMLFPSALYLPSAPYSPPAHSPRAR